MSASPVFHLAGSFWDSLKGYAWRKHQDSILAYLALGSAFFLRVHALAAQSLWNDEGTSVALAGTSVGAILNAAARDIHPPLYYLLLHYWIPFTGSGEFAVRFLSVFAGVLVVAMTFRLACELFSAPVALLAAYLSALSPFQLYYSQEARMYIWVTFLATCSVWALVRILLNLSWNGKPLTGQAQALWWSSYAPTTLAALYTNYYAFTLLLVENLAFVAWLIWMQRTHTAGIRLGRVIITWFGVQALIAFAFLPWLLWARASITAWPAVGEPLPLAELAWRITSSFATGLETPEALERALVVGYLLLFCGGLVPVRALRQSGWGIVLGALWALAPLLAMYALSLVRPAYQPKFLLLATPGFLILVARGLSLFLLQPLPRALTPAGSIATGASIGATRVLFVLGKLALAGAFVAGAVLAVSAVYFDPRLRRDDYRRILNYINAVATESDAVIVDAPGQMDVVRYYFRSQATLRALPIGRPVREEETRAAISDLVTRYKRLFAIYWATEQADPQQLVERLLSEVAYKASDDWHGNVRFAQYAVAQLWRDVSGEAVFGEAILLRRVALGDRSVRAGDILPLELVWVALAPPPTAYKVFVHLLDGKGRIIAQHDGEPQNGFRPTHRWQRDDEIVDKMGVWIPPGTPPGEYVLVLGLYRADNGERLRLINGTDHLVLATLPVAKGSTSRAALFLTRALDRDLGMLRLLGYNAPDRSTYARGEFIPLALYWQARVKPIRDLDLRLQLADSSGIIYTESRAFELYPTTRWNSDEIVRDVHNLMIPPQVAPGEYRLMVSNGVQKEEIAHVVVR